jgi:phosphoribosylformimino-5-aminoimidazole carboxamide ribotide isomerase
MTIYPSIDILGGKCVRLTGGRYDQVTVYSEDPVEYMSRWIDKGAKFLHVVDLDGARSGKPVNDQIISKIARESHVPVQVGGGIRSIERISDLLDLGIRRVILGTAAVKNPQMLKEAVGKFNSAIVAGIDAKDGYAAVEGWKQKCGIEALDLARDMEEIGVETIIYTDISRDGMLVGPNIQAIKKMAGSLGCEVIASGGVKDIGDLKALSKTGVTGVIVGKALYEGRLDLEEAVRIF